MPIRRGGADQDAAEVLKNGVIRAFIRAGRCCPGNRPLKSDVAEFVPVGIRACFNVPQTLSSRRLEICRAEELVEGGEGFYPVLSSTSADAKVELMPGEKLEQLAGNGIAGIYGRHPKVPGGHHRSKFKSKTKKYVKEL